MMADFDQFTLNEHDSGFYYPLDLRTSVGGDDFASVRFRHLDL